MQHPDEGTIHSWLDNALPADEAARVASHVAECPQCAAAVAEARGFIAASSRILTALDDVPRGVVPAVPARTRDLRVLWRAAAAVLVVAGGSFVVMRDGGREDRASSTVADRAVVDTSTHSLAADKVAPTTEREFSGTTVRGRASGVTGSAVTQGTVVDLAAPTIARTNKEMQLSANAATGQRDVQSLKELSVERTPGSRRVVYQISPTDTVTLTEIESLSLQSVVTTGIASAQDRQQKAVRTRAVAPMRAEPSAAAAPPVAPPADSGRADSVAASTGATAMTQAAGVIRLRGAASSAAPNTVRWVESATGKTLILSGNLPVEKLQEIKQRIETERAAARKKSP